MQHLANKFNNPSLLIKIKHKGQHEQETDHLFPALYKEGKTVTKQERGAWKWELKEMPTMPILMGSNNEDVCNFGDCSRYDPIEGSPPEDADAKLIASAPDLLEALTTLLSSYQADFHTITGGTLNDTEAVIKAKEAIKKATI